MKTVRCITNTVKYRLAWYIAAVFSFVLYYSGIVNIFITFRKRILKTYHTTIIMYHRIRDDNKDPDISVPTWRFEEQLLFFKSQYSLVQLSTVVERMMRGEKANQDELVITFDDGYKDNYDNGFPLLQKHNIPATIFLISGLLDSNEEMLRLSQIHEMQKSSIEFGSHTINHPILSALTTDRAKEEIAGSKEALEKYLDRPVRFFAYPKGKKDEHYNDAIVKLVIDSGYDAALSTVNGKADQSHIFELNRLGIRDFPIFMIKTRVSGIFESMPFKYLRRAININ